MSGSRRGSGRTASTLQIDATGETMDQDCLTTVHGPSTRRRPRTRRGRRQTRGGDSLMMPMTRQQIEILLDTPDRRDYVVSAYADMTVKDGFNNYAEVQLKNE